MAQAVAGKDRQPFFSRSFLTEHPVVSYFVLAYAISWLIWLPLILYASH